MRPLLFVLLFLAAPILQAQAMLGVNPARPRPGEPALFTLSGVVPFSVSWDFGDGTPASPGGAVATHTFARAGSFITRATYALSSTSGITSTVQRAVFVGITGPSAPFSISYLALRWEDGTLRRTVNQGDATLAVYADLKYEGTGLLQGQWLVDGVPLRSFSRQLTFANRVTLTSGKVTPGRASLALPTNIPGEHTVTLQVFQPLLAFEVPVIRYFVSLGPDPEGPVLRSVMPRRVRAGEEAELVLSGERLRQDMELHLGRDLGVVGPIRMAGPEQALVKVFVAPTARPGVRQLRSSREKAAPMGSASLEILPAAKKRHPNSK